VYALSVPVRPPGRAATLGSRPLGSPAGALLLLAQAALGVANALDALLRRYR
jgi:hypothetical protein